MTAAVTHPGWVLDLDFAAMGVLVPETYVATRAEAPEIPPGYGWVPIGKSGRESVRLIPLAEGAAAPSEPAPGTRTPAPRVPWAPPHPHPSHDRRRDARPRRPERSHPMPDQLEPAHEAGSARRHGGKRRDSYREQ